MSGSVFAACFTELVGEPAMHDVASRLMHVAHLSLNEDRATVGELAARLGCKSEAALNRAFKRFNCVSPGVVRCNGDNSGARESPPLC
jgi:AraC-like DNA-binding protein